jgi:hypothetical protein
MFYELMIRNGVAFKGEVPTEMVENDEKLQSLTEMIGHGKKLVTYLARYID